VGLAPIPIGGFAQWWGEGHNQAAWDHVTSGTVLFYVGYFALITVVLAIFHFLRAHGDVVRAHRHRWEVAEPKLAALEQERSRSDAPQIGQYVDKLYEVKLPDDPAVSEVVLRQLGLLNARFTTETNLPERREVQPPQPDQAQAGKPAADDHADGVTEL
jgi:hypothetical protein